MARVDRLIIQNNKRRDSAKKHRNHRDEYDAELRERTSCGLNECHWVYKYLSPRSFAERALGFSCISSSVAVIGFLVSSSAFPLATSSRKAFFTMRSSSEWKLMMPSR